MTSAQRFIKRLRWVALAIAGVMVLPEGAPAYVLSGPSWAAAQVPYYVNTDNMDLLSANAVETSIRYGANTWPTQAGVNFSFMFAGQSAQTTTTYDGTNLVVFRNASNGSAIATTYWWSSGGHIIDADIVFWDGGFTFFSGSSGCSGGFYIEDIAAHEFGHALGLGHSDSTSATMYYAVSSCNTGNRTLDPDDIAGVRALYPLAPVPTPPLGLRVVGS